MIAEIRVPVKREVTGMCVRWAGRFVADVGRGVSAYARFSWIKWKEKVKRRLLSADKDYDGIE